MSHYPFWPVTIAAIFVVLALVFGRLKLKAQPLRLELADKCAAILDCPDVSESERNLVKMYLDSAFSFRAHLLLAHLVIPAIAVARAFQILSSENGGAANKRVRNAELQSAIEEVTDIHLRITLANHPILCTSVLMSVTVNFAFAYVVVALIGGVIPSRVPPEEIAERVEYAYARVRMRGPWGAAHGCA